MSAIIILAIVNNASFANSTRYNLNISGDIFNGPTSVQITCIPSIFRTLELDGDDYHVGEKGGGE